MTMKMTMTMTMTMTMNLLFGLILCGLNFGTASVCAMPLASIAFNDRKEVNKQLNELALDESARIVDAAPSAKVSSRTQGTALVTPYQVPFESETVTLPISENGVQYRLTVRQPLRPLKEGEKVTTVYVLDALWNFPAAASMFANAEFLGHVPPIRVVGIGYVDDISGGSESNRVRDYTPSAFAPKDNKHFLQQKDYVGSGGAEKFLDVLEKQIIPLVEERYPATGSQRVIVGKSLGGLAATYALLSRPQLFSHYLIISPALWWDDFFYSHEQRVIGRLEQQGKNTKFAAPISVFVAMGDGEERLGMLADVHIFARAMRLRNDPNLTLKVQQLSGELHETIFPAGYVHGIRHLLGTAKTK